MGAEKDSAYYDKIYKESTVYNNDDVQHSPYYELWKRCLRLTSRTERIADFGCGNGLFAKHCLQNERNYVAGYDFSQIAIDNARRLNPDISERFFLSELLVPEIYKQNNYDIAFFIEVLEHIDNDISILQCIPSGKRVIITLPNYDSDGHVRYFKNIFQVVDRYCKVLKITSAHVKAFDAENKTQAFIINAVKR